MEKEQITVNIDRDTKELVIRHGDASKPIAKKGVELSGSIFAATEFYLKRRAVAGFDKLTGHVLYSYNERKIILVINEDLPSKSTITAQMKINPVLESFSINSQKIWTLKELTKQIRMNKMAFKSGEEWQKIINQLENFKADINTKIQQAGDNRGNKTNLMKVDVTGNIAQGFVLKLPVFLGTEERTFKVDICYDVRDQEVDVWLESTELATSVADEAKKTIDAEISKLKIDLVCIEQ